MKNNIDNLLARYFSGNASESDLTFLEEWIAESDKNEQYFNEMTRLYEQVQLKKSDTPALKTSEAKKVFMAYISKTDTNRPSIELNLKPFYKSWLFRAASVIVFVFISATALYIITSEKEVVFATEMTPKQIQLSDETKINLSKNSKITYSSKYSNNENELHLSGEATFYVGHKGKRKLKVIANETFIEDIGTVFTVKALPESDVVKVSVREGQIHFYTLNNNGLILNAFESGIYNKKTKIFKVLSQHSNSGIVGAQHIDFENVSLNDAIEIISNAYNIDIRLAEQSIGNRRITVNFDGEDVNVILQIMTETLNLNVKRNINGYQLSNKN
ncbi:MAG: FecR family protein [Paludibacter sp.]|nr:FecR family protein [Paludibacter sp.]